MARTIAGARCCWTISAAALLALTTSSSAQTSVEQFYKGRQITVVIPAAAGGGYDQYGRLVARHIVRFSPGNPGAVATNMVGGAGVVATQYAYTTGAKDGGVLAEVYPNAILDPLLGSKGEARYDPARFNYIGSVSADTHRICFVRGEAPLKTFAEAFEKQIAMGATGVGAAGTDYPSMYNSLLGTKFKIIPGYGGTPEILLAMQKGEIDGTCGVSWSSMQTSHPEWFRNGTMRVIAQESLAHEHELDAMGAPLTVSFAKTDEARRVMEFVYAQATFGRPFLMAPEVPAERIAAVRAAFARMIRDPEFLAEAAAQKLEIEDPLTGDELQGVIQRLTSTPKDVVERTKQAIRLQR